MSATKLQGASLFLLICRDLQDSVSTGREDPSGRRTRRRTPVYRIAMSTAMDELSRVSCGEDLVPSQVRRRPVLLERAPRTAELFRVRSHDVSYCRHNPRPQRANRAALRRAQKARGGRGPDEQATGLLQPDAGDKRDSLRRVLVAVHPRSELVG